MKLHWLDIRPRRVSEEGISDEKPHLSECPVGRFVGCFLHYIVVGGPISLWAVLLLGMLSGLYKKADY